MSGGDLPIDHYRNEILGKISEYPVVIVKGDAGCGKSKRAARFVLEQSPDSGIAVGEPLILASRKLAERVAGELHQPLCRRVGYINGHGIMLPESDAGRRNSLAIFGTFRLTTACSAQRALRKHRSNGLAHTLQREKCHTDGPNARGRDGTPALQLAVESAQPKMIKRRIKLKTNVNAICKQGLSALDFAVSHKDVQAASLLVSLRADASCARTRRAMKTTSTGQACTLNDALAKAT